MRQCSFDFSHQTTGISIPPGRKYADRAEMLRVLRYHRGWKVKVFHEDRVKWWVIVTGSNISEIRCDLPGCVADNHMPALTSIYARIANMLEAAGTCGHS